MASTTTTYEKPAGHPDVGDSAEPCPFLTPQDRNANANIPPANGGKVPRALSAIVFLDILAVGLVIPLLSNFAKDLGGGAAFSGVLGTAYGATQLLGASVLGSVSDVKGRRLVYILSVVGAIAGYATLLAAASYFRSLPMLFLSRLPIGLVKQTMTCSQSIICDCTSIGPSRSAGLARLGVAAGLGFIIGPAMGGILSSKSRYLPVKLSLVIFFIELLAVYFRLPETSPASRGFLDTSSTPDVNNGVDDQPVLEGDLAPARVAAPRAGLKFLVKYHAIRNCIASMLLVDIAYSLMHSTFALYTQEEFDMVPKQTGFTLAYVGILSVGVQISWPFFNRKIKTYIANKRKQVQQGSSRQKYPEYYLALLGTALLASSFLLIILSPNLTTFLLALAPLAIGHALFVGVIRCPICCPKQ